MNWKRAKNFIIICLFTLNVLLYFLNIINNDRFIVSNEQITAVKSFAEKNNVKIKGEIPLNFDPDEQIIIKNREYDIIELQRIFFDNGKGLKRTDEFGKVIIVDDDESILIQNNTVYYEKNSIDDNFGLTEEKARETAYYYENRIENKFCRMEIERIIKNKDHYSLTYSQNFGNIKLFNNYLIVNVYEDGFISAEFAYSSIGELTGIKSDICSADEAVFIFINEMREITESSREIIVDKIDYGYYGKKTENDINGSITAVPCYRFFTEGEDSPYYINAYSRALEK